MKKKPISYALIVLAGFLLGNNGLQAQNGMTRNEALLDAADYSKTKAMERVINQGASINTSDMFGYTPLILSAIRGNRNGVILLLNNGAEIDQKDTEDTTALAWAATKNNVDIVQTLIQRGADINTKDNEGFTPLMLASRLGNYDAVEALLKAGADASLKNDAGKTALMLAEEESKTKVVALIRSYEESQ
jgi:ankyrin repeat protein